MWCITAIFETIFQWIRWQLPDEFSTIFLGNVRKYNFIQAHIKIIIASFRKGSRKVEKRKGDQRQHDVALIWTQLLQRIIQEINLNAYQNIPVFKGVYNTRTSTFSYKIVVFLEKEQ